MLTIIIRCCSSSSSSKSWKSDVFADEEKQALDGLLNPGGLYFFFCNNIDLLAKYTITLNGISYHVLPCDESTVWKEMLELTSVDKNDIKKLDTAGKLDYVLDAALAQTFKFETISYEDALARMEPVKNRNVNRPV